MTCASAMLSQSKFNLQSQFLADANFYAVYLSLTSVDYMWGYIESFIPFEGFLPCFYVVIYIFMVIIRNSYIPRLSVN